MPTIKVISSTGDLNDLPVTLVVDPNVDVNQFVISTPDCEVIVDAVTGKVTKRKLPKFESLPNFGNHMTWVHFCELVADGSLMDDDGSGELATSSQTSDMEVYPSRIKKLNKEEPSATPLAHPWATHVVWYNK